MHNGEAANAMSIVFGLTRLGLKPMIYSTRGKHAKLRIHIPVIHPDYIQNKLYTKLLPKILLIILDDCQQILNMT
jgi:hypothetical protein